ncbi:hypothetical protein GQR58_029824 [Nymphon striatum]|nr:hypothetical protein GQR58_029824 [Nymphon striatum]
MIERGDLLGENCGVALRQDHDAGRKLERLCRSADPGEPNERVGNGRFVSFVEYGSYFDRLVAKLKADLQILATAGIEKHQVFAAWLQGDGLASRDDKAVGPFNHGHGPGVVGHRLVELDSAHPRRRRCGERDIFAGAVGDGEITRSEILTSEPIPGIDDPRWIHRRIRRRWPAAQELQAR